MVGAMEAGLSGNHGGGKGLDVAKGVACGIQGGLMSIESGGAFLSVRADGGEKLEARPGAERLTASRSCSTSESVFRWLGRTLSRWQPPHTSSGPPSRTPSERGPRGNAPWPRPTTSCTAGTAPPARYRPPALHASWPSFWPCWKGSSRTGSPGAASRPRSWRRSHPIAGRPGPALSEWLHRSVISVNNVIRGLRQPGQRSATR